MHTPPLTGMAQTAMKDPPSSPSTPTTTHNSSSGNLPPPSPSGSPLNPGRRHPISTSTNPTGSGSNNNTPLSSSSSTQQPSNKHKHRRVLSAVEGSAAQSFLVSALDTFSSSDLHHEQLHHPVHHHHNPKKDNPDSSTPVTSGGTPGTGATTFSQWNNAALSKATWDNGDTDGLLLPPVDGFGFDGNSSVAATAAASTSSHRSILSNSSDELEEVTEEDETSPPDTDYELTDSNPHAHPSHSSSAMERLTNGLGAEKLPEVKRVRVSVQQQLLHQRRLQNAQARVRQQLHGGERSVGVVMERQEVRACVEEWKKEFERGMEVIREQQKKEFDRMMAFLQAESSKRSAIESRLHAQLLLQSESMVAMELKLLRLEAKVHQKEQRRFQRLGVITNTIEEDLPLEDILQERQPRAALPPERAVVSSGASLVSAVTATSGLEDGFSLKEDGEIDEDDEEEETQEVVEEEEEGEEGSLEQESHPSIHQS